MAEMMKSADQQLNQSLRVTMKDMMSAFKDNITNIIKQTAAKQNAKALQRIKEEFLEPVKTDISGVKNRLESISSEQWSQKQDITSLKNEVDKLQNKARLNVSGNILLVLCSLLTMYYFQH